MNHLGWLAFMFIPPFKGHFQKENIEVVFVGALVFVINWEDEIM